MARHARLAVAAVFLSLCLGALAADPVAFVSDLRGDVVLDRAGRPQFLAELLPGSRLVLGPQASAAVMFVVSGEEFDLKGPGEFAVTKQNVRAIRGALPASRTPARRVSASVLVEASKSATASLRMRSAAPPRSAESGPRYPAGARIATLQPTLRWAGPPESTYAVVVMSADGKEIFRGSVKGLQLRLPVVLAAEATYAWHYALDGRVLGDARFETLPAQAIEAAEKARADAGTFTGRVRLALVLQDLGALHDAREIWAQLAAERQDLPEIAGLAR